MDDAQVIAYLRKKAAALVAAADALEGTASEESPRDEAPVRTRVRHRPEQGFNLVSGQATVEGIRELVSQKSARAADLAKHFNTSEIQIKALIEDPNSGLVFAERGWIKLAPEDGVTLGADDGV